MIDAPAGFDFNVSPTVVNLTDNALVAAWVAPGAGADVVPYGGGRGGRRPTCRCASRPGAVALARLPSTRRRCSPSAAPTTPPRQPEQRHPNYLGAPPALAMGITGSPAAARGRRRCVRRSITSAPASPGTSASSAALGRSARHRRDGPRLPWPWPAGRELIDRVREGGGRSRDGDAPAGGDYFALCARLSIGTYARSVEPV